MPRKHTYESLAPDFEKKHATLVVENEGPLDTKKSKISWICQGCKKDYRNNLGVLVGKINNETISYMCSYCNKEYKSNTNEIFPAKKVPGKKGKVTTFSSMKKELENLNYELLTTIEEFEEHRKTKKGPTKMTINAVCRLCDYSKPRTFARFRVSDFKCYGCDKLSGTIELYENFCLLMDTRGWKMLTSLKEFILIKTENEKRDEENEKRKGGNCAVKVWALDSLKNKVTTTYNHFQQGHNSKEEYSNSCLNDETDKIQTLFEEKGYFSAFPKHPRKGEKFPFSYPYYCGCMTKEGPKVSYITLGNLKKNDKGCNECRIRHRTTPWEHIESYMLEHNCEPDISRFKYETELTPIFYKCSCGGEGITTFKAFKSGVRCNWCATKKRENTNKILYGSSNPFGSEKIKQKIRNHYAKLQKGATHSSHIPKIVEKRKETNIKNIGATSQLCLPEVRKKGEQALIKKCGTAYPLEKEEYRQKGMATTKERYGEFFYVLTQDFKSQMIEKYGSEFFLHSEEFNNQMMEKYGRKDFVNSPIFQEEMMAKYGSKFFLRSDTFNNQMIEKYGQKDFINSPIFQEEMMEKYGSKFFLHSKAFKKIMVERWGVEHASQNVEIFKKMLKTAFKRDKTFIFPSGRVEQMMGYECFALADLLAQNQYKDVKEEDIFVQIDDVPIIKYFDSTTNANRVYYPDIYLRSDNLLIEVKCPYLYKKYKQKNKDKWAKASLDYKFEAWIYHKIKGKVILTTKYVYSNGFQTEKMRYDENGEISELDSNECDDEFKKREN